MIAALQTLVDNGLSDSALDAALEDLIEGDSFDDDDDRRKVVALAWYRQEYKTDPDDCTDAYGDAVSIGGCEYRVLTDDEADTAFAEYVEQSLWAFNPSFLSGETGINESVFEALSGQCEDANDPILSIIRGSCGLDDFIEAAKSADGRGPGLSGYDGEELEYGDYYLYRTN